MQINKTNNVIFLRDIDSNIIQLQKEKIAPYPLKAI